MNAPTVSVIVPAYRARSTLPLVFRAVKPQVVAIGGEVVLVESERAHVEGVPLPGEWLRVLPARERLLPGKARNLGAHHARGELLAFLDADSVPQDGWLDALLAALTPAHEAVAGAILNGTPNSRWGTAEYLLEFLEWAPSRTTVLEHAASCNLLVRRGAFERAGGFPERMRAGEDTVFTAAISSRGTLAFAPLAQVVHLNRTDRSAVLANQRRLGRAWVEVCRQVSMPGARLTTPYFAPLAVIGRLWAIVKHSRRYRLASGLLAAHAPFVVAGQLAWGLGVLESSRARRPSEHPHAHHER